MTLRASDGCCSVFFWGVVHVLCAQHDWIGYGQAHMGHIRLGDVGCIWVWLKINQLGLFMHIGLIHATGETHFTTQGGPSLVFGSCHRRACVHIHYVLFSSPKKIMMQFPSNIC